MLMKLFSIVVYNSTYSPEDIILNKLLFEDLFKENDFVRICDFVMYHSQFTRQNSSLIMQIKPSTMIATSSGLEISLSKSAADSLHIKSLTTNRRKFILYRRWFMEL